MRVLVDSSAWVDFLNGHPSKQADRLDQLLGSAEDELFTCGVVVSEVFQGLRRPRQRREIEQRFRLLGWLEPSGIELHLRAAELYRALRSRGRTVRSTIDCLLAVLAEEADCAVLARDRDFTVILESGLVKARLL